MTNRDVLVIGGGIAGMQSALLLSELGHQTYIMDNAPAIGGFFPLLDRQFPTNSCGVCFMSPKPPAYCPVHESELNERIEVLTNCDVKEITGQAGNFEVRYVKRPRKVAPAGCNLCGRCAEVCPVEVSRELGGGIEKRKAIHLPFEQAIPRSYLIDEKACTGCGECEKVCEPGAINLAEKSQDRTLKVGAVVLGFGFAPFQAHLKGEYGFGRYKNVVSSIQYERMLSSSSPTQGFPGRPSDGSRPARVAFIQCVGSRDVSCKQAYCSKVCCMYATKQAMVSHDRVPGIETTVFYMDLRAVGKGYEQYCERAKSEYGVRYLRSAISTVREIHHNRNLVIEYGLTDGSLKAEEFDLVVLSVGFSAPPEIQELSASLGIELNEYGFCASEEFSSAATSRPGLFVAGAFREPCDIPEAVVGAGSAAADVSVLLRDRFPKAVAREPGREPDASGPEDETLRIGLFICENRGLLAQKLDLARIRTAFSNEPDVVLVENTEVTSRVLGAENLKEAIRKHALNRALLAGFRGRDLALALGEEPGVFAGDRGAVEYVDIGSQCAYVHGEDRDGATAKAESLIRAGLVKTRVATARAPGTKELSGAVLVVGGGIAGLTSALTLARLGMAVTLVEKAKELGGNALRSYFTLKGSDIQALVADLVKAVEEDGTIDVLREAELVGQEGTWGDFLSEIRAAGEQEPRKLRHGAVIFATGAREKLTETYLYGKDPRVVTQREFEKLLATGDPKATKARTVVMIQCVDSRDAGHPYCSQFCCNQAVKNLLKFKDLNPEASVYALNRDIRNYGFYEKKYWEARGRGAIFCRYEPDDKPRVSAGDEGLTVTFRDELVKQEMNVRADLVVLSTGVEPNDNDTLVSAAGIEVDADGFFQEANPKSAPLDSVDRGKFFCGLCRGPGQIEDALAQGKAAAIRAAVLLWSGRGTYAGDRAFVNARTCAGCGLCVSTCPYGARVLDEYSGIAVVREDICKGCGTCVVSCPNGASQQQNFEKATMLGVLDELMR